MPSQPTSLYLGFQTTGTEPANVQFRANNRADAFVGVKKKISSVGKDICLFVLFYSFQKR